MSFIVVGTNHKYSPVELRERISFSRHRLNSALIFLKERGVLEGAVIISTCNRIEIYASVGNKEEGVREILGFISRYHEIDVNKLAPYLYIYDQKYALKHLALVASGLDSLILGETQILHQIRSAFSQAQYADFVDDILNNSFDLAFSIAKKVHSETKIAEGKVSAGSVAVEFIRKYHGTLSKKKILILGVGKVTQLVLKYLKKGDPKVIFISNRTFEKAQNLAQAIGAEAVRFERLNEFLQQADIVITATASPHFIIREDTIRVALSKREKNKKLLFLDLALPRDVSPEIRRLPEVELFYLEDLEQIINENVYSKQRESSLARIIIEGEIERKWGKFTRLEQELAILPLSK